MDKQARGLVKKSRKILSKKIRKQCREKHLDATVDKPIEEEEPDKPIEEADKPMEEGVISDKRHKRKPHPGDPLLAPKIPKTPFIMGLKLLREHDHPKYGDESMVGPKLL